MTPRVTYPQGEVTPHGAFHVIRGRQPMVGYRSPDEAISWHLMGGMAPHPLLQDGVVLKSMKGLIPPWKTQDQQGATQDGVTFNGAVYDPIEADLGVVAVGRTPVRTRKVIRHWIDSWDVKRKGELYFISHDGGYWYAPIRWFKTPVDSILGPQRRKQPFTWTARVDDAFWRSLDSVCEFPRVGAALSGGNWSGFQTVSNIGDQPGWVNHVAYGPFTSLEIANGPNSTSMIKFGPLLAGQIALLRTEPRRRGVYDITPAGALVPTPQLNPWQQFLAGIEGFATNFDIPTLLRQFESLLGAPPPPQTELYSLLQGRFTRSIPAKPIGAPAVESNIAVKITGGTSATRLVTYLTPMRRYPL